MQNATSSNFINEHIHEILTLRKTEFLIIRPFVNSINLSFFKCGKKLGLLPPLLPDKCLLVPFSLVYEMKIASNAVLGK